MHELSIAQSIVESVMTRMSDYPERRVVSVRLRIGDANAIEGDSLAFSFEMLTAQEPVLTGAMLRIERVPHRARCRHCEQDFPVVAFVAQCPLCAEWSSDIVSGTEFSLLAMELEPLSLDNAV